MLPHRRHRPAGEIVMNNIETNIENNGEATRLVDQLADADKR